VSISAFSAAIVSASALVFASTSFSFDWVASRFYSRLAAGAGELSVSATTQSAASSTVAKPNARKRCARRGSVGVKGVRIETGSSRETQELGRGRAG
jgi:hypothetical protein